MNDTTQPPSDPPPEKKRKTTLADLSKEDQAEIRGGSLMKELQEHKGWEFYKKIMDAVLAARRNELELTNAAPGEDGNAYALRMERIKGTIIGIRLALQQPSVTIAAATDLRKRLLGTTEDTDT